MTNVKNELIAKRYSDALIELVRENNSDIHEINSQLKSILESLNESAELKDFMDNPVISADDKKSVISDLLSGKVDNLVVTFIKLLVDKNRFSAFEDISKMFDSELDNIDNKKRVNVTSAIELNDGLRNRLIEKLSYKLNKNIELVVDVNPEIIAGLVIKIDDNIIDMSLKHKFEELNKEMTK